jgi:CubicO group peptidase (beta-lactamase class C family)
MAISRPPRSLPRSTAADQQVDPAAILSFIDAVDDHPDIEMHSLMLVRRGQVVAEGWWAPYSAERPQLLYSLSKIFTSTAAAFARAEGLLGLDDTVISHFPEFDADITDPGSRSVRVRDIASMASGHTRDTLDEAVALDPAELVRGFLLIPPDRQPGTVFAYNQPCTYTLASIIQRNAGMPLTQYLRPRLFDPLGIGHVGWQTWPDEDPEHGDPEHGDPEHGGRELGFSGLHARTEDIAKLGQLYLQHGQWNGVQLIPGEWVEQATSARIGTPDSPNPDWQRGYGFQFWMARHGYRGDGAFGQYCVILPEHEVVIVTTAYTHDMQALLDAMWTHLLPGLSLPRISSAGPGTGSAQDQLDTRLRELSLPACQARLVPADWDRQASRPFPVSDSPDGTRALHALSSIEVAPEAGGWQISLIEPANRLTFPVGAGSWTTSVPVDTYGDTVPVAASGGWLNEHTLRAEIIFLETPHRMDIECSRPDRTSTAVWRHPSFGKETLRDLHCPR